MKKLSILSFCLCFGSAFAEPVPLPPVVDTGTYPAPNAQPAKPLSTNTLFEIMGRLEQLQQEVQQLTGKVEEQTYQLNELKKRQNTMYTDFDDRIQALEGKLENAKQAASETSVAPASVEPEAKPAEPAPAPTAEEKKPTPTAKPETPAVSDEKKQYQHAYDELRNGRTSQAISEFNAFINEYPGAELAGNAQYWLGEAYKVNREIDAARSAFQKVIDAYPGSAKVPDALLKLGYIELDQKNTAKAREYLNRVVSGFSGSTAAHLAAKKLQSLDEIKN